MRIRVGTRGRILIPKPMRHALGLDPGDEVEVSLIDGRLELEPNAQASAEDVTQDRVAR